MNAHTLESTFDLKFTSRAFSTGIPTTLAGTPAVEIYEDNGTTQITAAETLTVDFDSVTGLNNLRIAATAANGFEVGKSYSAVISAGTVDSVSAVGETVYNFRILTLQEILPRYSGPRGPGVYLNDGAANTNTVNGTDGTINNPVSTIAAAKTLADSMSIDRVYLVNDADITLAATMVDYEFVGIGEVTANIINLGSQDVSNSAFYNLCIEGTQGGSGRLQANNCSLRDPGAGATTLHILAKDCGILDQIEVDTSSDNVFDQCYSLVAGTASPIIIATGASGTISIRHFSGGIEFQSLSASHNISLETDGQVIFDATCNVNASVSLRGNMTITDNTAGMTSLTTGAVYDKRSDIAAILVDTADMQPKLGTPAGADISADIAVIDANVDQLETAVITNAAGVDISADVAAMKAETALIVADTNELQTDWVNGGRLDLILDTIATDTTTDIPAQITALNDISAADVWAAATRTLTAGTNLNDISVADILTTQMTESYAANTVAPTLAQALFAQQQMLMSFAISGTSYTVKKLDNSTTAFVVTLNDGTSPTGASRA